MDANWRGGLFFVGYAGLCLAVSFGFVYWRQKRKGERPPVDFVLLRGPGESLRRKIAQVDEDFSFGMFPMLVIPILAAGVFLYINQWLGLKNVFFEGGMVLLALVVGLFLNAWWLYKKVQQRRNCLLGYLGERAVAENLEKLLSRGFRVFHDVPVGEAKRHFNLDHVAIGHTGVFLIETKTRRKGRARKGYKEHEVQFDGQQLIWPWGEDQFGLNQAMWQSEWLRKWIHRMTGEDLKVQPVLALPGWYVVNRKLGKVAVHNPKNLESYILGLGRRVLTDEQIDLISRQLEERCRDVED